MPQFVTTYNMKYIDSDGKEIEISLSPEEINKLKENSAKWDTERAELSKKAEMLENERKALVEENKKLSEKELNFGKLRHATQAEKDEILKEFTAKERTLASKIADVENQLDDYRSRNFTAHKNRVLNSLAGNDKTLMAQIEDAAKSFAGEARSEEEVEQRLINGFTLVKGTRPTISPLSSYHPSAGTDENLFKSVADKGKKFTETEAGREFYEKNFPKLVDKKK